MELSKKGVNLIDSWSVRVFSVAKSLQASNPFFSLIAQLVLITLFVFFCTAFAQANSKFGHIVPVVNLLLDNNEVCNDCGSGPKLLFKSGFETTVTAPTNTQTPLELTDVVYDYQRIVGDDVSGFAWDKTFTPLTKKQLDDLGISSTSLWGSFNNGIHLIDGGGVAGGIQNKLQTVTGHKTRDTTALYQQIDFSNGDPRAQTPFQIDNIDEDPEQYYISYWMKLDDVSMKDPVKWRVIWQYKSDHFDDQAPTKNGFRISIFVYTDRDGKAFWHVQGDDLDVDLPVHWEIDNKTVPVPRDEWFKVEVYSKVSAKNDGRFWVKINGNEIAAKDGPNLGSYEDSLDFIMLWQLYSNSYPAYQWIDDVEIWDGIPKQ